MAKVEKPDNTKNGEAVEPRELWRFASGSVH